MIFIEASNFSKFLPKYLTDDDYRAFQFYLLRRPDAGSVVPGSGGIRKIRWKQTGKGKTTPPSHILERISEEIHNE
jgi:hypothetical protein